MFSAFSQAGFLVLAMAFSGVAHVIWLNSQTAQRFSYPVDGGRTFRKRRIFGDNKRLSGFLVLPPATGLSFWALSLLWPQLTGATPGALWDLSSAQYAMMGFACGLVFLVAELPNSFLKRQLGIAPGGAPTAGPLKVLTTVIDRLDSVIGCLIAVSLIVPVPFATWVWVFALGICQHAFFSFLMFKLGLKRRAL